MSAPNLDVLVKLCAGRPHVGPRFSVGPYTPALPTSYLFAVLDLRGEPIVLAHDAFAAAAWWARCEAEPELYTGEYDAIHLPTDTEAAESDLYDRAVYTHRWRFGIEWWAAFETRRARPRKADNEAR